jgi:tetratricopeptide (TPR) repeat protein
MMVNRMMIRRGSKSAALGDRYALSKMKHKMHSTIAAIVALVILSGVCRAYSSRGLGSSIGSPTVPPSSRQTGLTSSPSQLDSSGQLDTGELGNLTITGNVTGGKHFRGLVPYQSTRDFRATLGSASLDSFLRSSAGSEQIGGYPVDARLSQAGVVQPFYSPSGSVATFSPGASRVLAGSDVDMRARSGLLWTQVPSEQLTLQGTAQTQELSSGGLEGIRSTVDQSGLRTSRESQERGRSYLPRETYEDRRIEKSTSKREEGMTPLQYQERMEQLRREIEDISGKARQLDRSLSEAERSSELDQTAVEATDGPKLETFAGTTEATEPSFGQAPDSITESQTQRQAGRPGLDSGERPLGQTGSTELEALQGRRPTWSDQTLSSRSTMSPSDSFDQIEQRKQLDSPQPSLGQTARKTATGLELSSGTGQETGAQTGSDTKEAEVRGSEFGLDRTGSLDLPTTSSQTEQGSALQEVNQLSDAELSSQAKRILGSHETYASFAKAKYKQYIQAGWTYLNQGRYYRAVDAYTLASVYKSEDPVAYAGKSLALFAAGEYMSSALFLSRALQILPEYAGHKVDMVSVLQDRDKLEDRILDAERSLQSCQEVGYKANASQLQFLLGYVYLQAGRLDQAYRAIEDARESLGGTPAVAAVKKAIDEALSKQTGRGRSTQQSRSNSQQTPGGL